MADRYLISALSMAVAAQKAAKLGLAPHEWTHVPWAEPQRTLALQCVITTPDRLIGFFDDRERFYLEGRWRSQTNTPT